MIRYEKKFQRPALALAALAGFVDAIGFLKSGRAVRVVHERQLHPDGNRDRRGDIHRSGSDSADHALRSRRVSQPSGNRQGDLVHTKGGRDEYRRLAPHRRRYFPECGSDLATIALLCLAMGASNTIFRRDGEVSIGVTYMTGTLVSSGTGWRTPPSAETAWPGSLDMLLWLALVSGGILGSGFCYARSPAGSIWIASGFCPCPHPGRAKSHSRTDSVNWPVVSARSDIQVIRRLMAER